jgi:hypothetical protein
MQKTPKSNSLEKKMKGLTRLFLLVSIVFLLGGCGKNIPADVSDQIKEAIIFASKQNNQIIVPKKVMYIIGEVEYNEENKTLASEEAYPFSIIYLTLYDDITKTDQTVILFQTFHIIEAILYVPHGEDPEISYQGYIDNFENNQYQPEWGTLRNLKYGILDKKDIPSYKISQEDLETTPYWLMTDHEIQLDQATQDNITLGENYIKKFVCTQTGSYVISTNNIPISFIVYIYDSKGKKITQHMMTDDNPLNYTLKEGTTYYFVTPYRDDITIHLLITRK